MCERMDVNLVQYKVRRLRGGQTAVKALSRVAKLLRITERWIKEKEICQYTYFIEQVTFTVQTEKGWGSGVVGIIIHPFCGYKVVYIESCREYQMIAVNMRNTHAAVAYMTPNAAPKHLEELLKNCNQAAGIKYYRWET